MSGAASCGTDDPIICVAGSLNFSGLSPWAASVGRLWKRKRAGGKAVKSEYAGTDAFVAYCRSCHLVFQLFSHHHHHQPLPGMATGMCSCYLLLLAPRLGAPFTLLLSCFTS